MPTAEQESLIHLTEQLIAAIGRGDWETYTQLCDPTISCFEPEARGHLVEGLEFHRFYFGAAPSAGRRQNTLSRPHVRLMGDAAVVSYVRLVQHEAADGSMTTSRYEETRVWQRTGGQWRHVHFHRSVGT